MKRLNAILVLTALVMCCFSCKKDPQNFNEGQIKVTERQEPQFVKANDTISVELLATCKYSGSIKRLSVQVGFAADLADAISVEAKETADGFEASFPVQTDKVYYYRYVVHRYSDEFEQEMEVKDDTIYQLSTRDLRLPSVTTKVVKFVSVDHALGCGSVTDDNGETVIERGFCWGTHPKPRLNDSHQFDGSGMNDCFVQMKELVAGTIYYARAYAKNRRGISYGKPMKFTTLSEGYLSVITVSPINVGEQSATFKGHLKFSATGSVNRAGFLYGTNPNTVIAAPVNINVSHTGSTIFLKIYSQTVSTLENNTKYYVRAYAVNDFTNDTIYGETKSFTTYGSSLPPAGELTGAFSVDPMQQVEFSPGNLQYQASTNKWRFANQQWEYIGDDNENISASYYGWIDLFGWGTSGNNHGAVCYQPWSTSSSYSDYYAYGGYGYNLYEQTGLADWGSNTIYLGGEVTEGWRTLTSEEWYYLFNTRTTQSGIRYAKAQLNIVDGTNITSVNGMIVFPNDWIDNGMIYRPNTPEASYTSNIIYVSDWKEEYESKGVVFLPAAGRRLGTYYYKNDQQRGYYWSASKYDSRTHLLYFYENGVGANSIDFRYYGQNVRLVRSFSKN